MIHAKIHHKSHSTCRTVLAARTIALADVLVAEQRLVAAQRRRALVHVGGAQIQAGEAFAQTTPFL